MLTENNGRIMEMEAGTMTVADAREMVDLAGTLINRASVALQRFPMTRSVRDELEHAWSHTFIATKRLDEHGGVL